MRTDRRSSFHRLIVLPLTLVAFLSGCYKWHDYGTVMPDQGVHRMRVTLLDNSRVTLHDARIDGDSIVGKRRTSRSGYEEVDFNRFAIGLDDVRRVEVSELDKGTTAGLIFVALAVPVTALIFCADAKDTILEC